MPEYHCDRGLRATRMPRPTPPARSMKITAVLDDPCASHWLKDALRGALMRDPVDAAADADMLNILLQARVDDVLRGTGR